MHERYYMGHKPNVCGKGYKLTIHMRTHTEEKPYKCSHCLQAFAQSNDLKAHIRRHTGDRFRCDIYSGAFWQRYGLNTHLRTVHGIKVTSFTGRLRKTGQCNDIIELIGPQEEEIHVLLQSIYLQQRSGEVYELAKYVEEKLNANAECNLTENESSAIDAI